MEWSAKMRLRTRNTTMTGGGKCPRKRTGANELAALKIRDNKHTQAYVKKRAKGSWSGHLATGDDVDMDED